MINYAFFGLYVVVGVYVCADCDDDSENLFRAGNERNDKVTETDF